MNQNFNHSPLTSSFLVSGKSCARSKFKIGIFYTFQVIIRMKIGYTRKKIQNGYVQNDRNGSAIYLVSCKSFTVK